MAKTITIRIDDDIYELFKKAAEGERRCISNFIEYATLSYLNNDMYVSENEMSEILLDAEIVKSLKQGLDDVNKGKYFIVE